MLIRKAVKRISGFALRRLSVGVENEGKAAKDVLSSLRGVVEAGAAGEARRKYEHYVRISAGSASKKQRLTT